MHNVFRESTVSECGHTVSINNRKKLKNEKEESPATHFKNNSQSSSLHFSCVSLTFILPAPPNLFDRNAMK